MTEWPYCQCGCLRVHANARFYSKACHMRYQRAQQTPAQRSALGKAARATQQADVIQRLVARVKLFADTEDARIVLAYRYGKRAWKVAAFKARQRVA